MMKKLIFTTLFWALGIWCCQLLASPHPEETREYKVGTFENIYLNGGFKVYINQKSSCALSISADEDELDDIIVSSESGTLKVKYRDEDEEYKRYKKRDITLYISLKQLKKIDIDGGVSIETKGTLELEDVEFIIEGGARMDMEFTAHELELDVEGGAWITFEGSARKIDIDMEGAGRINAREFKTQEAFIDMEGAGIVNVYATELVDASIEGVGKVNYRGNPKEVRKDIEGLGAVSRD